MNMEFNQHIIEYMTHCYSRQLCILPQGQQEPSGGKHTEKYWLFKRKKYRRHRRIQRKGGTLI